MIIILVLSWSKLSTIKVSINNIINSDILNSFFTYTIITNLSIYFKQSWPLLFLASYIFLLCQYNS